MTSKKKLFLLGSILFLIMSISGIYSLTDEINKTESGLSTSAVDISMQEYNQNNEIFLEDGKKVMPGDEIILIPRIENLGIDCYLRAKITYTIDQETLTVSDYIEGNYTSWTKKDDYYYYDSILEKGTSIDLFNKIKVPNLNLDYQGKTIVIHIIVEAVQAKNFDKNWDNVVIKDSVDRTYDIDYNGSTSVIYEDDAYHYVNTDNHFFDNLGNLLPGDTMKEEITIKNDNKSKKEFFFAVDYNELSDLEKSLLQKISFVIKDEQGNVLVETTLADKKKYSLGVFSKNNSKKRIIELSLSKDIDNDYSKLFTKIIWRFSYEIIPQKSSLINPKTWDLKFDLSITVFILSAIGFTTVLFLGKKDTDFIENKKKERGKKI